MATEAPPQSALDLAEKNFGHLIPCGTGGTPVILNSNQRRQAGRLSYYPNLPVM